jgi:hypothetical protein
MKIRFETLRSSVTDQLHLRIHHLQLLKYYSTLDNSIYFILIYDKKAPYQEKNARMQSSSQAQSQIVIMTIINYYNYWRVKSYNSSLSLWYKAIKDKKFKISSAIL